MIEVRRARSWGHLHELVFGDPWPNMAGTWHSNMVHRGMCDQSWGLTTTLQRRGLAPLERHLVRNFRKYAQLPGGPSLGAWEWLVIAQHHGLPTRLLDWTYSPHVALHFATDDPAFNTADGVVWSVDFVRLHDTLPAPLAQGIAREGAFAFTTTILDDFASDPHANHQSDYALIFEPPSIDERVVNQYAGMSVTSRVDLDIQQVLKSHPECVARKTVIPARLKPIVRERLDQGNINERVIYPGLDGLSRWLTRYYSTGRRGWI